MVNEPSVFELLRSDCIYFNVPSLYTWFPLCIKQNRELLNSLTRKYHRNSFTRVLGSESKHQPYSPAFRCQYRVCSPRLAITASRLRLTWNTQVSQKVARDTRSFFTRCSHKPRRFLGWRWRLRSRRPSTSHMLSGCNPENTQATGEHWVYWAPERPW